MTLYEIEQAMLDCANEDGEVVDIDRLNELEMAREEKISNIACWIKDCKAEAEAIRAEKKALDKRLAVAENKEKSLENYLKVYLNGEKYKDGRCSISYRKSVSTKIDDDLDVNTLPDEYKRIKVEANKTAIKDALDAGIEIEGCSLVENTSVIVR